MDGIIDLLDDSDDVLVVTHTHADLDAVGSAVGLAETLDGEVDVVLPAGATPAAREVLDEFREGAVEDPTRYDCLVVVDSPSTERIDPVDVATPDVPVVLLDHHEREDLAELATATRVDTDAPATALLVADLIAESDHDLTARAGFALAAGSWSDARGRTVLDPAWRPSMQTVLDAAGDRTAEIPGLVDASPGWSERVATAKAVHRAEGYSAGDALVLVTRVGSHETAAAKSLLAAGADVALVVSERGERTWVVARTDSGMGDELPLPATLFRPLADEFGGSGGGHEGAGIAKVDETDAAAVRSRAVGLLEEALGVQFARLD